MIAELPPMHGADTGLGAKFKPYQASAGQRRSQIQRRTTMTSRIANLSNLILSLSLATGLLCAGATASAQTTASVTVPFAFSADNQNVAAGSYKVELLSDRYLSLRNIATNQTRWIAGTSLHSEMTVQQKRESQSATSQATPPSTVELALK
jgi:hypothetical protein